MSFGHSQQAIKNNLHKVHWHYVPRLIFDQILLVWAYFVYQMNAWVPVMTVICTLVVVHYIYFGLTYLKIVNNWEGQARRRKEKNRRKHLKDKKRRQAKRLLEKEQTNG